VTAPAEPLVSVVLVDDSTELRELVRHRLERTGRFDVVAEGADGDQAISLVIRHEPDLLLLDTSMPICDGLQALPAITAVCPDTCVVMFTGFHEQGLADRARELGAADFVEKSISLEDLPARLSQTLRGFSQAGGHSARARLSVVREAAAVDAPSHDQALVNEHVAQFQDLFEQATIGMATLTVTGTVVRANPALADLMSCRPFDLVGVDYGRLTGGAGVELDSALSDIASAGRDLVMLEHPLPTPDGLDTERLARLTLAPIRDSRGQALYVFAQVQDISELRAAEVNRRASERHFRLLVAAVREYAIFMLDVDGTVVSWNIGAQRVKGYLDHEIIGRSFKVFYPPELQAAGHPEHNLELALRDGAYAEEGWRVRKDGTRFWASVLISRVYDDTGRHVGFAKITRDQSIQRQHEQDLKDAVDQQAQFLSVTAHELRTPTLVIEGSASALQRGEEELSDRALLFANIRGSARRLHRLAADLATASQVQRGTLHYEWEDVSLIDLLHRAVARAKISGLEVDLDAVPAAEVIVRADAIRLAQAVDNLLDNAGRHGAPPVHLGCTVRDGIASIRVLDSGGGVPAHVRRQLFERFAIGGGGRGTGLGLYLVREIVQAHDGEVEHHPPGQGRSNAFEIRLPAV
jgi:PAS domain S-box-containing protein